MELSARPIFILGAPRSGTTLMRSIIDAHPNIFCPPWETGLFVRLDEMLNGDLPKIMQAEAPHFPLCREELINWARRTCDDLMGLFAAKAGKPRWAEKTPAHVYNMRLIGEVVPECQFIHMIRNGYEVVRSLQNMHWAPRQIGWSTERWTTSVAAGRECGAELGTARYLEVRYEDLTKRCEPTLRTLCEFLGEPFDGQMLGFNRPENNSWGAERKAVQDKPVNKHRDLGLLARLVFRLRAGALQRELGYRS
jgi:hypothetical protein